MESIEEPRNLALRLRVDVRLQLWHIFQKPFRERELVRTEILIPRKLFHYGPVVVLVRKQDVMFGQGIDGVLNCILVPDLQFIPGFPQRYSQDVVHVFSVQGFESKPDFL